MIKNFYYILFIIMNQWLWIIIIIVSIIIIKQSMKYSFMVRDRLIHSEKFKTVHSHLRTILSCTTDVFQRHGIKNWWLDSGSLLGHVRHDGFIPHDDDIDIAVHMDPDTKDKLEQCYETIRNEYPMIEVRNSPLNVGSDKQFVIKDGSLLGIFVDLFYVTTHPETNTIRTNGISMFRWPNGYYHTESTYPLQQVTFEGCQVNVPKDPRRYLSQMYGEDCFHVMRMPHLHSAGSLWEQFCVWWIRDIPMLLPKK